LNFHCKGRHPLSLSILLLIAVVKAARDFSNAPCERITRTFAGTAASAPWTGDYATVVSTVVSKSASKWECVKMVGKVISNRQCRIFFLPVFQKTEGTFEVESERMKLENSFLIFSRSGISDLSSS
jgi:hypothetical protein